MSYFQVLPFGELHVRLLQEGPKVGAVPFEALQASERTRWISKLAALLVNFQREIPCDMNGKKEIRDLSSKYQ
jgi:hypothetical protein